MKQFKIQSLLFLLICALCVSCSHKGETFPSFNLANMDGATMDNTNLKGKFTVVTVWATWCGPCIQKIPLLNSLAEKYPEVQFWAFNDEDPEKVKAILYRFPFHATHFSDADEVTSQLQTRLVKTYPQYIIVNKKGHIIYDNTSESSNVIEEIESILISL